MNIFFSLCHITFNFDCEGINPWLFFSFHLFRTFFCFYSNDFPCYVFSLRKYTKQSFKICSFLYTLLKGKFRRAKQLIPWAERIFFLHSCYPETSYHPYNVEELVNLRIFFLFKFLLLNQLIRNFKHQLFTPLSGGGSQLMENLKMVSSHVFYHVKRVSKME